jgi:hypothetical protein
MKCVSLKEGYECFFMKKSGCQFNGGACQQIIEQCEGCQKAKEFPAGKYCLAFPEPAAKWRSGNCSMATHLQVVKKEVAKVNPLKASKRGKH